MKKIFFGVIMLATVYIVNAQDLQVEKSTTKDPNSSSTVPVSIRAHFQATYPTVTSVTWERMNEWCCAIYKDDNNRLIHVYYSTQPYYLERDASFKLALPVMNTFVPEGVITSAISSYGNDLYGITTLKAANNGEVYQVCLIKNGVSDRVMMNGGGVVFTDVNKTRPRQ